MFSLKEKLSIREDENTKAPKESKKQITKYNLYTQLIELSPFQPDALRIAEVDALLGLTKWSGGYLAECADFAKFGLPSFYFTTISNSGSFTEYFNWRRVDSYGYCLVPKRLIIDESVISEDRVELTEDSGHYIDLCSLTFDRYPPSVVICDLVDSFFEVNKFICSQDLDSMITALFVSSKYLTPKGVHVVFLNECTSETAKQYIAIHAEIFEEITLMKTFLSESVLVCRKIKNRDVINKLRDRWNPLKLIPDSLNDYVSKFMKTKKPKSEHNYPKLIASWGL